MLRQLLAPPIPICWLPAPLKVWLFCMELPPELLPKGDGSDGVTVWFIPPMELAAAAAAAACPALYLAFMMSLNCCNPLGELSAIDGPFRKAFCAEGGVIPGG